MKIKIASLPALLLAGSLAWGLDTGQPAPDFALKGTDGKSYSLKDQRGKIVVLEWINHGCPFVKKHYDSGNMQDLQVEAREMGVTWLSICSSAKGKQGHMTPAEWIKTTEEKGALPTAVLLDEPGKVGKLYGAKTTPHMYIIDAQGVLIYQGAIDDKPSADPKDVVDANNYVRAALLQAVEGRPVENATTKPYGCSVKYK